jgi:hypothetical protein
MSGSLQQLDEGAPRYVVGIDLGTTNSALAYVDRASGRRIRTLELPQLVGPGQMGTRPILPSFCYLPGAYELPAGSAALPWDKERPYIVGELAREQGAVVPGRLVASAKSWLCHAGVDRTAPILPWGAEAEVEKISPVEASARYLRHMREAWNEAVARGREAERLEEQTVILTVPASFDEVARELTVAAAHEAGLGRVILLEEPLAAFYAWLSGHESDWEQVLKPGQLVLVCDVGGGTTDFTIVAVQQGEKGLGFNRLAVGEHLMLGGDNMDLSLARHVEAALVGGSGKLEAKRWHQLVHQCRRAKELLLADKGAPDRFDVSLAGTGGKLIAGTLRSTLERDRVQGLLLDGFFPQSGRDEMPQGERRRGLTEGGLPYVQDPAVTRHLAEFWRRFRPLIGQETGRSAIYPDFVLFNGGALIPELLRRRLRGAMQSWFEADCGASGAPRELENPMPELAVAIGAAYSGLVRLGAGVRVGAGSPRAYYVEVGSAPAEDGRRRHKAVCLVPRGVEEGFETELREPEFQVLANQPVRFQMLSSSTRLGDRLGEVVELEEEETTALPPIRTVLRFGKKGEARSLPAHLLLRLSEVGTLELGCRSLETGHRWQLSFDVRQDPGAADGAAASGATLEQAVVERAQQRTREAFTSEARPPGGGGTQPAEPRPRPESLVGELTAILEIKKPRWPSAVIRKLADALLEVREARTRSAEHEARWLNLLGFCLRPGYGDPLDEWRVKEAWKLFPQGLAFPKDTQCRLEWWIFWRRVAGGLGAGHQARIHQDALQLLSAADKGKGGKKLWLNPQEELELWMALANFERLAVATKLELGRRMLARIRKGKPGAQELWVLSRFGGRIPLYGPLDRVVPASAAAAWADELLSAGLPMADGLAHAVIQLVRATGDRGRDAPHEAVERVKQMLRERHPKAESFVEMLDRPETALGQQEQDWVFGEALPSGLILIQEGAVMP